MPCLLPWRVGEFASTLAGLGVPLRHTRRPVLRESVRGAGSCLCGGGCCLPSACRPCGLAGAAEMTFEVCSSRVALVCGAVVQREMGPDRGRSVVVAKAKSAGGRLYCCPCAVIRESYIASIGCAVPGRVSVLARRAVAPFRTSSAGRQPAKFKHINKRRKRNQPGFPE